MTEKFNTILNTLSPSSAQLFAQQIPAYREGYINYVYQTDKPDVQVRRIKQMDKNFQRYLANPYYYALPLDEESEKWFDKSAFSDQMTYRQVIKNGVFIGYFAFLEKADAIEVTSHLLATDLSSSDSQAFQKAIREHLTAQFEGKRIKFITK